MNRDTEQPRQPVILEGEIIAPGPARDHRQDDGQPRIHIVQIGWFGKTIAILGMVAIIATIIVLAAGALLILLPIAILGAALTWWRIRKLRN